MNRLWQLVLWIPSLFFLFVFIEIPTVSIAILVTIIVVIVGGLIAGIFLWRHDCNLLATSIDTGLLALIGAASLAAIFSLDPSRSWRIVWQWYVLIFVFYICLLLFRSGADKAVFGKAFLVLMSVVMLSGYGHLFAWLSNWIQLSGELRFPPDLLRIAGIIGNPNPFAAIVNIGLLVTMTSVIAAENRHWIHSLWLALYVGALILSGSRGAWLGAIVGIGFFVGLRGWQTHRHDRSRDTWRRPLLVMSMMAVFSGILIVWIRPETLRFGESTGLFYRTQFWKIALDAWSQHPVAGAGPNTYVTFYLQAISVPFDAFFGIAHGLLPHTLAEMGLLGVTAVLFLFGQIVWVFRAACLTQSDLPIWVTGYLSALITVWVHALVDSPSVQILFLSTLLLAALISYVQPVAAVNRRKWLVLLVLVLLMFIVSVGLIDWRSLKAYEAGVAEAVEGQWSVAATHFDRAQRAWPGKDSASLYGQAFAYGKIAAADPEFLEKAVFAYENLVKLEPGWSTHHANLAGLYWQQGEAEKALNALDNALNLAPDVSVFQLNRFLWLSEYQAENEALRQEALTLLTTLPDVWLSAPFWQNTSVAEPQQVVTSSIDAGYGLLLDDDPETAVAHFQQIVAETTQKASGYLGLGIAQRWSGSEEDAKVSWNLALAHGQNSAIIDLWRKTLPDVVAEHEGALLADFEIQTAYGPGRGQGNYATTTFSRFALPDSLLPQLTCFTVSAQNATQFHLLQDWFEMQGNMAVANEIELFLLGDGRGLTPCSD